MSKGIILYQSKYGATKKYVDWLIEATNYEAIETKKATLHQVKEYEVIILGGGIYASGIAGLSFLKKNIQQLRNKKLIVFAVGASPYEEVAIEQVRQHNMKNELQEIPFFYCRGAWNEEAMSFTDRTLCKMLQKSVAKKDPATFEPWMSALMESIGQQRDWTDQKYLEPLMKELNH